MLSARTQFRENIKRVRALGGLSVAIESLTTSVVDVSDLWRAQVVLVVSALDHFVHELVRLGMIESAKGSRRKTDAYLRFDISMAAAESALSGTPHEVWVGETVRERHSWQSFQDPDKLADAIRLISSVKLWERTGAMLGLQPKDLKIRLKLIVNRRNQIAHEADLDPSSPGFRWPISAATVNDTVDFLEGLGEAVYSVAV